MRYLAPLAALFITALASTSHADKRRVPDYDNRGEDPVTAQEALWWCRSASWSSPSKKRASAGSSPQRATTCSSRRWSSTSGRASIGLYAGVDNLWFDGHQFRLRFAFGGLGFWKIKAKDRVVFDGGNQRIGIYGAFRQREDDIFGGIGPDVDFDIDHAHHRSRRALRLSARKPDAPQARCVYSGRRSSPRSRVGG